MGWIIRNQQTHTHTHPLPVLVWSNRLDQWPMVTLNKVNVCTMNLEWNEIEKAIKAKYQYGLLIIDMKNLGNKFFHLANSEFELEKSQRKCGIEELAIIKIENEIKEWKSLKQI